MCLGQVKNESEGLACWFKTVFFKMFFDETRINSRFYFFKTDVPGAGVKWPFGVAKQVLHQFLVAAAENKIHVLQLLDRRAQDGLYILFRVVEYLLEFVKGDHGFYFL